MPAAHWNLLGAISPPDINCRLNCSKLNGLDQTEARTAGCRIQEDQAWQFVGFEG